MAEGINIKIYSKQISIVNPGQTDEFCSEIAGQLHEKGGNYYLIYEEKISDDMPAIKTTLKIYDHKVQMSRKGQVSVTLLFEEGAAHKTGYITPYGTFGLNVITKKLDYRMDGCEMEIELSYELELDDVKQSICEMKISGCRKER